MTFRTLAFAGVVVLAGFAVFSLPSVLRADEPDTVDATRALPVDALRVRHSTAIEMTRTYTGQVVSRRNSELGFQQFGLIRAIHVEEGDRVEAGAVIAELDAIRLEADQAARVAELARAQAQLDEMLAGPRVERIAAARAAVREAEARRDMAQREANRVQRLAEQDIATPTENGDATDMARAADATLARVQHELEELENGTRDEQIAAQRALVSQLEASLASITDSIDKTQLRAPYNAIVDQRVLDEGTMVTPGEVVMHLMEADVYEARVGVPPSAIDDLATQTNATLRVGTKELAATFAGRRPRLDRQTRTIEAIFLVDAAACGSVAPGEIVRLDLTRPSELSGIWVPVAALQRSTRGLWSVGRLRAKDTETSGANISDEAVRTGNFEVERCEVEVVHANGERALVRGVLQDGDVIIAAGIHRVVPGQRVRIATLDGASTHATTVAAARE